MAADVDICRTDGVLRIGVNTVKMIGNHRESFSTGRIPAEEIPVRKHLRSRDHPLCRGIDNRPLGLRAEKQLISLAHLIASHTAEASGNLRPSNQCRVLSHPRAAEKNDLCLDSQPEQIPGLQIMETDAETIGVLSGNVHEALEGTGIRKRAGSVAHAGQHREFFHENDIHG